MTPATEQALSGLKGSFYDQMVRDSSFSYCFLYLYTGN